MGRVSTARRIGTQGMPMDSATDLIINSAMRGLGGLCRMPDPESGEFVSPSLLP